MWLLTTLIAAVVTTLFAYFLKNKYKLGFLSLMLWGGTIMILTDHLLGYEGGAFLETETNGLIQNSTVLGLAMLVPVFIAWFVVISIPKFQKRSSP